MLKEIARQERQQMETLPEMTPRPRSIPQQMGDKWSSAPGWAKGVGLVILAIAGSATAIVQIIEAIKG